MPRISGRDVAEAAWRAGFRGKDRATGLPRLVLAVAIARGESGWNTSARALTPREDSRGLWQINVFAHPWGKKINLYNARTNARAAWRVYKQAGRSFRPWTVYTAGLYTQYLQAAAFAVARFDPRELTPDTTFPSPDAGVTWHGAMDKTRSQYRYYGPRLQRIRRSVRDITRT